MPVVDTSLIVALMLNEPVAGQIEHWLGSTNDLHAPDLLSIEVANALIGAQRRGRLDETGVRFAFAELAEIPIVLHPVEPFLPRVLDLCLTYRRRPYDAAFLALAELAGEPMVTLDQVFVRSLHATPMARWVQAFPNT